MTTRRTVGWLALLGAICAALPAAAQDEASPAAEGDESTIVVTGEATASPSRKDVREQAREVSRVGRYQLNEEALPRFEAAICPAVFGLRDDYAAEIAARIRANAARLEIAAAADGCMPNLLVAFMEGGRSFLAEFERARPDVFHRMTPSERQELLAREAPARVWNGIAPRWTGTSAPPRGWPKERASVRGQMSRHFMPEAKEIVTSLVVFDYEAVVGMTLTQLADYATMRGLSNTRAASGDAALATILGLFENGGGSPEELTSFDVAYLRGLYYAQPNLSAATRFVRAAGQVQEAREER